jgi:glycosyltransferase involved in cell wall biosynthesis
MRIAIDALNIRAGGGLVHLREFLAAVPGIGRDVEVTVFANRRTAAALPAWPGLSVVVPPGPLGLGPWGFCFWRPFQMEAHLKRLKPDVFFVPGGGYLGPFRPFVAMAQNLLPFEPRERARVGHGLVRVRLHLLEWLQSCSFRRAASTIFLSEASKRIIETRIGRVGAPSAVVYHGVNPRFGAMEGNPAVERNGAAGPFRWLYVSNVDAYKHQVTVAQAAGLLLREGQEFTLNFVGTGKPGAIRALRRAIAIADPAGQRLCYQGGLDYDSMARAYASADAFVFASSCETFGMIVVEAMAAGLPVAASGVSAIPEITGDSGIHFDPESAASIAGAMRRLMSDGALRRELSARARRRAAGFSWAKCARETMAVLEAAANAG